MNWLTILGDAFWILSLAFIGVTLRQLSWKVGKDVRLPMPWAMTGRRAWRWPRDVAFGVMFGVPLLIGLGLSVGGRLTAEDAYWPLIFFALKTATAGLAAILHLGWLRGALRTLLVEGALKP